MDTAGRQGHYASAGFFVDKIDVMNGNKS